MGIIRKQTIWGTIYTYLGALLGVLTNLVLLAWFFTPEQIGLLNILVAYSLLFAQLANLGFDNVTIRLFPYFRDDKKNHGFFGILLRILLIGAIVSILLFILLFPVLSKNDTESNYFQKYGFYVLPLILVTLFFNSLDTYSRVLYKAVRGTFLKEVLQRMFIIIAIAFYIFKMVDFSYFVLLYVISLSLPTLILFYLLYRENQVTWQIDNQFLNPALKREMFLVSLFGIISVFSSTIVVNIDKIMIQQYLNLSETGIYSIAYYFGVIMTMPSRALTKISSSVVADAWKRSDLDTIKKVYYKSCINQLIFSLVLFVGIWTNMDNLLYLLPAKYNHIHWVAFWIMLGNFIDMATGINNTIIATSPSYKMHTYFMLVFVAVIVSTNVIFIPMWGITGAAFASALSMFIFNLIRWGFLFLKYKMQPFNVKYLIALLIGIIAYLLVILIPVFSPFYIDMFLRGAICVLIMVPMFYYFNISEDLNERILVYYQYVKRLLNKF